MASAQQGPMYAPDDGKIYVPVSLATEVRRMGGCSGTPCQAVIAAVVAHEIGHRVQHLLGLMHGGASTELQADCLSGAVLSHENKRMNGTLMESGDLEAIAKWQHAIGDDVIGGGQRVPAGQGHGTGAQRQHAFTTGWHGGTMAACSAGGAA
jgi:predicted metalloprotease